MYNPVTLKDIAAALNLSTSTVSRALRNSYEISVRTRNLVHAYAKEINYQSNPIALSLKNKRSYSIGVSIAEIANSFFSQTIDGIESIAYDKGYHVIISQSHDNYDREIANVNHLANRSIDGLLISMSSQTTDYSHLKNLHDNGLPIVFFDRVIREIDTHKVTANNYMGVFRAVESLVGTGHSKIALLSGAPHLSITIDRLSGYKAALEKHNITFNGELVKFCDFGGVRFEEVEQAGKELFSATEKPDAIFVANDRLTISFIRVLKQMQINPADITIIGFSNSEIADLLIPSFSRVRQPAFEMGQIAAELLINLIEGKYPVTEFETRVLDTEMFLDFNAAFPERQ